MSTPAPASSATVTMLRPVGSPLPLGFLALAVASFGFACVQVGWIAPTNGKQVAFEALLFTAPVQLLVAAFAFHARDSVVGTGMGILAGTWATVGFATLKAPPGSTSDGLGVVLLGAAACLLVPAVAASSNRWAGSVIALSAVRFAVTGVAQLDGSTGWLRAAGWVGLALAVWALGVTAVLLVRRTGEPLVEEPGVRAGV